MRYSHSLKCATLLIFLVPFVGCAYGISVHIHEKSNGYELHVPASKLAVTIPKNGFLQKENRHGGGTDNPRYFYFVNDSQNIIISGWFEEAEQFKGIENYWQNVIKEWKDHDLPSPENVSFEKISKWDAIIYEVKNSNYTESHILSEWVQAGTWIDMHISIKTNSSNAEARSKILDLLKNIEVKEI